MSLRLLSRGADPCDRRHKKVIHSRNGRKGLEDRVAIVGLGSGIDDKTCERLRPLSPERWLTRGIGDDKSTAVGFNGIE